MDHVSTTDPPGVITSWRVISFTTPSSWTREHVPSPICVAITGGTLVFLVLSGVPSLERLARAIPAIPVVLACAALNAFNEELTYKAGFLSVLVEPVGARNALRMVAAFFGLGHFYGVPYGVVGVVLAGFLGWILGRSMLETRGLWWAWWIHFLQDVAIFGFLVVGAITPGG
jgi:hypothetical protein